MSTLTEANVIERARLDLKFETKGLDAYERTRRSVLLGHRPGTGLSLGTQAITSPGFQRLAVKALKTSANTPVLLDEDVPLAQIDNGVEVKTLLTGLSDTSAGAFITQERADYVPQPRRRLRILDLVRTAETSVDAVEYARQTTFTNVAVEVAEATSVTTGTKPEATIAFEKRTENVRTFPVWVPATRRVLGDVTEFRATVDNQLAYAARRALEEAVVAAMVVDAGASQAKGADTIATAVLKLLTTLRNSDVEPTAALINPLDYETLRSAVTAQHTAGPPITVGDDDVERLFAIPLIVSASVPDDTLLIADMQAVAVWMRSLQIYVSASHASYFVNNLVAILAELRGALAVALPAGVGKVTAVD